MKGYEWMKTNSTACYCIFWMFWEWMGYAAWAAVHTYVLHGSINTEKSSSPTVAISHTHKKLHTQQHTENPFVLFVSSLTSARTIINLMRKELTLCCDTLTAKCCCAPSPVYRSSNRLKKKQLIMPAVVATYA